jgi:6-pyruvoyltetrahydropterin/6-carboxytetrahydropterin synthase
MNKALVLFLTPRDLSANCPSLDSRSCAQAQIKVGRTYRFESAHYLPLVPEGHKCKNLHGHNYRVEIVMRGTLAERGFIKDFAEIDAETMPLIKQLDHCLLNEVPGLENPTAEIIAAWFFQRIEHCERVRVYENNECWAEAAS